MQADILTLSQAAERQRNAKRGRHAKRADAAKPIKAAKPVKPDWLTAFTQVRIQPTVTVVPVQKPQQDLGREIIELLWDSFDPTSLKAFKLSEKWIQSPSSSERLAGALVGLLSLSLVAKKLDESSGD
jgi:hypothetical protein